MSSDLSRLLHALLQPAAESCRQVPWSPPVDIYRTRDGWIVKFDLAGVASHDVELTVSGHRLIMRGRRRDWCVDEAGYCSAYSMEIAYSEFQRAVELPAELDRLLVASEFRDGMLLVRLSERGEPP